MKLIAFGGGVDSSALLAINLYRDKAADLLGITRASLDEKFPVQEAAFFADTGWERDSTYGNVDQFEYAYKAAGIPFYRVSKDGENIQEWLMRTGTIPLMAGGKHLCSLKFKTEVMHRAAAAMFPAMQFNWSIGIEADEDRRANKSFQDKNDDRHTSVYPLRALGMNRTACINMIIQLGFGLVTKSACVGCPFAQIHEIQEIIQFEPEAWESVKRIEANFQATSPVKHQAWIDGGRQLIPMGKRFRAPAGQWRMDSWANGARLFAKKVNGRQLSALEWEAFVAEHHGEAR